MEDRAFSFTLLLLLLIHAVVLSAFCSYVARIQGRDQWTWRVLGFFFGEIALLSQIAIGRSDTKPDNAESKGYGRSGSTTNSLTNPSPEVPHNNDPKPIKPFTGNRDKTNSAYQLFLTRRFGIERNNTLQKFIIGDDAFDSLEEAITAADQKYASEAENSKTVETPAKTFDCDAYTLDELLSKLNEHGYKISRPRSDKFEISSPKGGVSYAYGEQDLRKRADSLLNKGF